MSPEDRQLCMLWWLWRLGPRLFGDDAALFRCGWCNLDGEGSRNLCPACCSEETARLDTAGLFPADDYRRHQ